jgi:hypothetical protein
MWQKRWGKFKSPFLIGYPWFWFDFFTLGRLIMITLDKWIPFYSFNEFFLFIFLYLGNTRKTTIVMSIQGHHSVQTPYKGLVMTWRPSKRGMFQKKKFVMCWGRSLINGWKFRLHITLELQEVIATFYTYVNHKHKVLKDTITLEFARALVIENNN